MNDITRKVKIKMFLDDYYFGYGNWITLLRTIGGPLLIMMGYYIYISETSKFSIAYSGVCMLYGFYMILKPYLWFLLRLDGFKTEKIEIEMNDLEMIIRDDKNESRIAFETFKNIFDRRHYFLFAISRNQRLRLPKSILNSDQIELVINKIGVSKFK